MEYPINDAIKSLLNHKLVELETYLKADVLTYYGPIFDGTEGNFLQVVEELSQQKAHDTLYVILTTNGGSATAVERYVKQNLLFLRILILQNFEHMNRQKSLRLIY